MEFLGGIISGYHHIQALSLFVPSQTHKDIFTGGQIHKQSEFASAASLTVLQKHLIYSTTMF